MIRRIDNSGIGRHLTRGVTGGSGAAGARRALRGRGLTVAVAATLVAFASATHPLAAQEADSDPLRLLDFACYALEETNQLPLDEVDILHLNPAMVGALQRLRLVTEPAELCTPIVKGDPESVDAFLSSPEADTLSAVDYMRYWVEEPDPFLEMDFVFDHQNPLQTPRSERVRLEGPRSFLTPVVKSEVDESEELFELLRYVDYACFATGEPSSPLPIHQFPIVHLNPVLEFAEDEIATELLREACMPVVKGDTPPDMVERLVASAGITHMDRLRYDGFGQRFPLDDLVTVRHINPMLDGFEQSMLATELVYLDTPATKRGQRTRPEACVDARDGIDFEAPAYAAGTRWEGATGTAPGTRIDVTSTGVPVTLEKYQHGSTMQFNYVEVNMPPGWTQSLEMNNVNLKLDFGASELPTEITFIFRDRGGDQNIAINGAPVTHDPLSTGLVTGLTVTRMPGSDGQEGSARLEGEFTSLVVGGEEFQIDDICWS